MPTPTIMAMKYKPQVLLGTDSHVMQWNPVLNIYRLLKLAGAPGHWQPCDAVESSTQHLQVAKAAAPPRPEFKLCILVFRRLFTNYFFGLMEFESIVIFAIYFMFTEIFSFVPWTTFKKIFVPRFFLLNRKELRFVEIGNLNTFWITPHSGHLF